MIVRLTAEQKFSMIRVWMKAPTCATPSCNDANSLLKRRGGPVGQAACRRVVHELLSAGVTDGGGAATSCQTPSTIPSQRSADAASRANPSPRTERPRNAPWMSANS